MTFTTLYLELLLIWLLIHFFWIPCLIFLKKGLAFFACGIRKITRDDKY